MNKYKGAPCRACGSEVRYKSNNACVECARIRNAQQCKDPVKKAKRAAVARRWDANRKQRIVDARATGDIIEYNRLIDITVNKRLLCIRERAKRKGQEFSITLADCPLTTHCPVFGLEFDWANDARQDNSPSLDRFDSNKGYVPGNVHWISWKANNIKSDSTADDMIVVAEWMKKQQEGIL